MEIIEILKAILFGIVQGVTEWLPISSTGHMIILNEFIKLNVTEEFYRMFEVVIQFGSILAVVVLFWKKIWPFGVRHIGRQKKTYIKSDIIILWVKILIACIPAAVIGLKYGDMFEEMFYNYKSVAVALIVFGIAFIIIEEKHRGRHARINSLAEIGFSTAFLIGIFQLMAAIFPGTSRSGATIVGALLLGVSRTVAAEFTFFLAIPVMLGASLVKVLKFGLAFSGTEIIILLVGMVVAFLVSLLVIKFLMSYIKRHDFKVFGWYRIILGITVLALGFLSII
jgi:undecaprenyl-diphosphatase